MRGDERKAHSAIVSRCMGMSTIAMTVRAEHFCTLCLGCVRQDSESTEAKYSLLQKSDRRSMRKPTRRSWPP